MTVNFDNAATTFPKPPEVRLAVEQAVAKYGSAGRGSHPIAARGSELVYSAREEIGAFFGAQPENVVFTSNCTHALNIAIQGLMKSGGHVIIIDGSSYEEVLEAIGEHGWTADLLILTHEHFDHIWFLEQLRDRLEIPVIACSLCSERIQDIKANLSNISDLLYYFKTGIVREGKSPSFTCREADMTAGIRQSMCRMRERLNSLLLKPPRLRKKAINRPRPAACRA